MLKVAKFGGSSVKDAQRIRNVASIIAETYLAGNDVIVVLSAQGDTTDDLIAKAEEALDSEALIAAAIEGTEVVEVG